LDPRKAELCYVDTDSCVWSLSEPSLDLCLLPSRSSLWTRASVLADERGSLSCHGKLKLEGLFRAGLFKTMKIYRLFNDDDGDDDDLALLRTAYTRCKGINRKRAPFLPDACFDATTTTTANAEEADTVTSRLTVHRRALRPAVTGEIHLVHEARSLAAPFNMKRYVTSDGLHTFPFGCCSSIVSAAANNDADDPDDNWNWNAEADYCW